MEELLSSNHWTLRNFKQRVRYKEAQQILINHSDILFQGHLVKLKVKHIGAGVYEVYKDFKEK